MSRLEFQRIDLRVQIEGDATVRIASGEVTDELHATTPAELWIQLATSPAVKHWSALPNPTDFNPIDRITIDIRDQDRQGQDWESAFARFVRSGSVPCQPQKPAIVRVSPVRPRSTNFPFTLPLRIVEVNPSGDDYILTALNKVFKSNPLEKYTAALRTTQLNWETWDSAALPADWPNAEVVHFDRLPPFPPGQLLSGDAAIPGTLGWFVEKIVAWQVRLVVLRCHTGGKSLEDLRRFAAAVVARGGPAVLVEALTNSIERGGFYEVFYEQLIHDSPIDLMWQQALFNIGTNHLDASMFVGAGREEQLRPSNVALRLFEFASEGNARARRKALNTTFVWKAPLRRRRKIRDNLERCLIRLHSEWPGFFFDFSERRGLLPLSDTLADLRLDLAGPVSASDLLSVSTTSRKRGSSARFVNCSFWDEDSAGELLPIDQKTGRFEPGLLYQLGIQIGPKSDSVVTVNETALLEEVFKWNPEMKGVWIEVGVSGIDFDVVGDPVQRVWLPAPSTGPTEIVYFAVSPRKFGVNRLRFAVYYEQNVIQSFRVAVIAGTQPAPRAGALAKGLDIPKKLSRDAAYLPLLEFSLAPTIDHFAAEPSYPDRSLAIIANHWNDDAVVTVKDAAAFAVNVSPLIPDQVTKLHGELLKISNLDRPNSQYPFNALNEGSQTELEVALRLLAERGTMLFNLLFDSKIWGDIRKTLDQPDRIIQVAQILRDKVIPWSFVYGRGLNPRPGDRDQTGKLANIPVCLAPLPDGNGNLTVKQCGSSPACPLHGNSTLEPENVVCPLQFWGFKHVLEIPPQQIDSKQPAPGQTAGVKTAIQVKGSATLVAGVNSTFASESSHFQQLAALNTKFPLASFKQQYTAADLKTLLAGSPIHIAYFFCHAEGGGSLDSRVILEAPGTNTPEYIVWYEFSQLFGGKKKWDPPALVFLNGCKTANYSPEALSPFLKSFVDDLGASGLIGTEITVWDVFAAEVGRRFFESFLNGDPAGAAVLKARRILLSKKNPLGLVYTLHASADLCLAQEQQE